MAKFNVRIVDAQGVVPTYRWNTEAAATALYAGEPCKLKVAGSKYVIPLADAENVVGTTTNLVGMCSSDSTQTASADGYVDVYMPMPGVMYEVKAKSASAVDTQAKITALIGTRPLFDLTSTVYTVDTGADNAANGLVIVGGDVANRSVYVVVRESGTLLS